MCCQVWETLFLLGQDRAQQRRVRGKRGLGSVDRGQLSSRSELRRVEDNVESLFLAIRSGAKDGLFLADLVLEHARLARRPDHRVGAT